MLHQQLFRLLCICALAPVSAAQIKSVRDTTRARVRSEAGPIATHEAERFALAFEEAVRVSDVEEAEAHVDWNAICTRAMNGIPAPEKVRHEFRTAADASLRGDAGIAAGAIAAVGAGGSCRFLRVVEHGDDVRALFRIAHADGSMPEYLAFVLASDDDGAAIATDVDVISDGGLVSAKLRRFFTALAATSSKGLEDKLHGADKLRAHSCADLDQAEEDFRGGKNQQALAHLDALPEELRGAPDVVLLRLNVARCVSQTAFRAALQDARERAPRNASVELLALDDFVLTGAHDEAHAALKAVAAAIGGDPYLDWLDATIFDAAGDLDGARAACRRAIDADASLEDAWWTLLSLAVRQEHHAEAAAILEHMAARFDVDWKSFDAAPAYADFLASDAGKAWKAKRAVH